MLIASASLTGSRFENVLAALLHRRRTIPLPETRGIPVAASIRAKYAATHSHKLAELERDGTA
jgi:hypothetical protein